LRVMERATAAEVGLLCEEAFLGTIHLSPLQLERYCVRYQWPSSCDYCLPVVNFWPITVRFAGASGQIWLRCMA